MTSWVLSGKGRESNFVFDGLPQACPVGRKQAAESLQTTVLFQASDVDTAHSPHRTSLWQPVKLLLHIQGNLIRFSAVNVDEFRCFRQRLSIELDRGCLFEAEDQ